jgi:hypothetical protein
LDPERQIAVRAKWTNCHEGIILPVAKCPLLLDFLTFAGK